MSYWKALAGKISDTVVRDVRVDASTHCMQVLSYEHHEIHSGSHYFVSGYQDVPINDVLQFTWQMPNTTKWIHWTWHISTDAEFTWAVYEGATINNALANAITPLNSNRNSSNTSDTTMRYEVHASTAAADTDVTVAAADIIQTGVAGSGRDGGEQARNSEIVMKQNELYVMRATSNGAAGYINFNMQWYEHTDKD